MMHYSGMSYGFMGVGWLFQILILILFFLIVWWIIKGSSIFGYKSGANENALDISGVVEVIIVENKLKFDG